MRVALFARTNGRNAVRIWKICGPSSLDVSRAYIIPRSFPMKFPTLQVHEMFFQSRDINAVNLSRTTDSSPIV
ncbi:hypothetical protein PUN28_005807 [Cardiocondyla obscurior]|uniref:Uncharacterized protein n=1 Tax=Cardiocondyla obscurior TaxID=286306 RepID=A0AAW2G7G0_9HYME